jgi:hypothetical protein
VIGPLAGAVGTVPGPPDFALLHEGAMPQKDQLCDAFWGSLTISAAGARRTSRCATGTTARPTEAVRPVRGDELVGRLHRGPGGTVDHPDRYPSLKRIGTSLLDGTDPKETCERCPRVC